jgi:serine/tyrosine/threonine adenylyltransferase
MRGLRFDNTYARELEGYYVPWQPEVAPDPTLTVLNKPLAQELGLSVSELAKNPGLFTGNVIPEGATPLAQAYAGHQFGAFNPMLGDGRALLLGEVTDKRGNRRDIALKGSGQTPFSRGGDGKAVLGPVLREYILGEAMNALGIPTTRALAAATTGEQVRREGHWFPGAVLTRVAASHLRVGTFELVRARGSIEQLRQLVKYALTRHYPEAAEGNQPALALLRQVVTAQATLIAHWMSVGFIHGVMNTDNMTISGETIDYGPCAFLEEFDPGAVFSSIDTQGRYRFAKQPEIASWNLARLAEALLPLIHRELGYSPEQEPNEAVAVATETVEGFLPTYDLAWLNLHRKKLGLSAALESGDHRQLIEDLLRLMQLHRLDFTLTWRRLAADLRGDLDAVRGDVLDLSAYDEWRTRWLTQLGHPNLSQTADQMDLVNPLYIPRNHLVEEALDAANAGNLQPLGEMMNAITAPFPTPGTAPGTAPVLGDHTSPRYATPAPREFTEKYVTFCGT